VDVSKRINHWQGQLDNFSPTHLISNLRKSKNSKKTMQIRNAKIILKTKHNSCTIIACNKTDSRLDTKSKTKVQQHTNNNNSNKKLVIKLVHLYAQPFDPSIASKSLKL